MISKKYGPLLFSLILSGLMSLLVSGISTFRAIGLVTNFSNLWSSAWLTAWLFAFPAVLLVAPLTRKVVQLLTAKD
jgi:Mn2+/Fe2+ NRAMP family transporter